MTQSLKCPECSASLEYPTDGKPSMRCPYCNSTVLLTGAAAVGAQPDPFAAFNPMPGNSAQLAEIIRYLKAGDKIGAIRVYRQTYKTDLSSAKSAVEKVAEHHGIESPPAIQVARVAGVVGFVFVGSLVVGISIFVAAVIWVTSRAKSYTPPRPVMLHMPTLSQTFQQAPADAPEFAQEVLQFGTEGTGAGGFKDARSIATDNNGHFFVGEYTGGRIQVFDAQGKFLSTWSLNSDAALLNLTADRHGVLYAITPSHIYRFEAMTGKPMGEVDTSHDDVREYCTDAYVALDDHLYVIGDGYNIMDFGPDNQLKHVIDTRQSTGDRVSFTRIVVTGTGEFFALDSDKGVFKFAHDGRYINRFGGGHTHDRIPGHLSSGRSLAADGKGHIYVGDSGIVVFDDEGTYLATFGGIHPIFGMAITDQNEIYACDRNKYSVRKFVVEKK